MAKIIITRTSEYKNKARKIKIELNGEVVGKIKDGQTIEFPVSHGMYVIKATIDWCSSNSVDVNLKRNSTIYLLLGSGSSSDLIGIILNPKNYLSLQVSRLIEEPEQNASFITQSRLKNERIQNYAFLEGMYSDAYFPDFLVDKVKGILIHLCDKIERKSPQSLEALYTLTHESTEQINNLEDEFYENGSELETAAREIMAADFEFIALAYRYEADLEEMIAPRDW
jgi:hypothetical protein